MFLISIVVIYVVLVISKVLPNPLLDTKDLVCSRENDYVDFVLEEKVIIRFDSKAKIKEYELQDVFKFDSSIAAKDYYELLNLDANNLELDKKNVIQKSVYSIKENMEYKGKTKEEIKKIYVEELFYTCR